MTKSSELVVPALAAVLLLSTTSAVFAEGWNPNAVVAIYGNYASGGVRDTHFNGSGHVYIYCGISGYSNSTNIIVKCAARDYRGYFLQCFQYNPPDSILHAINSVGPASGIFFRKATNSYECEAINIRNGSQYM